MTTSDNRHTDLSCCNGNLRVVVVDPSCFSLPYDYSLCDGLAQLGVDIKLARSEFIHSQWRWPTLNFEDWKHFYPLCHAYAQRHGTGRVWRYAKGIEHAVGMERFVAKMRSFKPDIIHFQWIPVPAVDLFFLKRLADIAPLVLTMHNTNGFFHGSVSRWQTMKSRSVFDCFRAVVVHAAFSQERILAQGLVSKERVHLIPHGALTYYRSLASHRETSNGEQQTILFFGSIEPYKGLDNLIEAFAQLPRHLRDNTRLLIAGKPGIDMTSIRERARALGIDQRIRWELRYLREEEVPQFFDEATLVALPYTDIDQSGVLMTALAFEKPLVASSIGGIAETIRDGVHGRLTPPDDVTALAAALESVLMDKDGQKAMQAAIRTLRHGILSGDAISRKTLDVYLRLGKQFCSGSARELPVKAGSISG